MSNPTVLIAQIPYYVLNIVIFLWILLAFRNTIVTLNQSQQYEKQQIVMQMFIVYVLSLFAIVGIFLYDQIGRGHPDKYWESQAAHMNAYFMVFIACVGCYAFILRPSNTRCAETFNQYADLNADEPRSSELREGPPCATNQSTEMADIDGESLDKDE